MAPAPVDRPSPPAPTFDADLTARATAGDPASVAALLRTVAPEIVRVVRGVLGSDSPDFDDAVQQSMVALVQALPGFRGECSTTGYACRIAFRTALRLRRGVRLRTARTDLREMVEVVAPVVDGPPSERPDASRRTEELRRLLDDLPEEQAEALGLRSVLGWTLEEVAAATNSPVNTVRSRLRLAKDALRRRIEADPSLAERLGVAP